MATEADMAAYANNGRDWDQLCQALVWNWCDQFGSAPVTYASALDAYYASPIESADAYSAPAGANVFFDIGAYGHVSVAVDDGQGMASSHVVEFWGINAGRAASVAAYVGATGAYPLGWSWSNGANSFPYEGGGGSGGGGGTDYAWGLSTDAQLALQQEMGRMPDPASGEPYYGGPADGAFGENSVAAMQRQLVVLGYLPADYAIDGVPGLNYGTALQELAADRGIPPYTGPIDGEPGDNTSVSLIGWANAQTPDPDPPDPPDPPAVPAVPAGTFFAVDVATSQAGFDFAAFKAAGGTRVIIKMGGGNASDSPYVAPEYVAQLAAARAAGLLVGHYWFNGRENGLTPTTSAQYFAEHADVAEGDVLALDVEREDATDTDAYSPDEVAEFIAALDDAKPSTGDPLLVYASESVVTSQDWSEVAATGAGLWVASWGGNDGTIPADDPDPGDWGSWDIWQYSSAVLVPGHPDRVDANIVQGDVWDRFGWHADEDPDPPDPDPGDPSTVDVVETLVSYLGESSGLAERYSDLFAALLPTAPTFDEVVQPDPAAPTPPPDGPPRHRRRRFGRGT